jgi:hypothetical protein
MRGWMIVLLLGYSAVLVLVYLFQERLVYFPEMGREIRATPPAVGLAFEDVHLQTIDGETIHGWWVPVQEARGVVLILHGNAGNISHRLDYLAMFAALGYTSLIIDYRGYGRSSGSPSEAGTYRDAAAAWEHLIVTRQVASHTIVLFGESLGGGVASWLAARQPVGALVLASTFTSIPHLGAPVYWFLPVRLLARIHYDNVAHLRRVRAPVLIAHSPDDEVIPYAHGQALFAVANEPKQFLMLAGGHNEGFIFTRRTWVQTLGTFLEQYRVPAGTEP